MNATLVTTIGHWPGLSLEQLDARARLLDRAENKYVVPVERLAAALDGLARSFDVLEIDGCREFTYDTVYFDDARFGCFRHHVQGRRRRMKVRSRRYVESGLGYFEVKLKGLRGRTIKQRMPYDVADHGTVTSAAATFLAESTEQVYGERYVEPLSSALGMTYRRITLVGRASPERVTIDAGLSFRRGERRLHAPSATTIVEVKSPDGRGVADLAFRRLGIRGQSCSKYCVGLTMLDDSLTHNPFNRTLRSDFAWKGPDAMSSARWNLPAPTLSPAERDLLARVVRRLPNDLTTGRPADLVERIVTEELIGFSDARVRSYLEILVTRAVSARLRERP